MTMNLEAKKLVDAYNLAKRALETYEDQNFPMNTPVDLANGTSGIIIDSNLPLGMLNVRHPSGKIWTVPLECCFRR
jgi:hypothetical protein